jgi:hypothetical protein
MFTKEQAEYFNILLIWVHGDGIHLTPKNALVSNGYNIFTSQLPLQGCAQQVLRSCHWSNHAIARAQQEGRRRAREAPKGILVY